MVNEIITGVSEKIQSSFGEGYPVYRNERDRGEDSPCFIVSVRSPSVIMYVVGRRKMTVPLDVGYFPAEAGSSEEMLDTAEKLLDALEYIALKEENSGLRGSAVSWEIAEGMLHFYITYCALQKKSADLVYMEGAEITAGTSKDRPGTDE